MSIKQILIILIAGVAAVAAAVLFKQISSTQSATPAEVTETVRVEEVEVASLKVLVASRDLEVGELITPDDIIWANWPEATVNINQYTDIDSPDSIEELTGSVVRTRMYENEPIIPQKIVQKGETGYMAAILRPGMRAISVEIRSETGAGGFILPDDHVDVILTHDVEIVLGDRREKRPVTTTIIENARVLAIDTIHVQGEGEIAMTGSTATLELPPKQAELLALGERLGTISLALRSVSDVNTADGAVTARTDMLTGGGSTGGIKVYKNGEVTSMGGS